jgi:hypothetical protein
VPDWDKFGEQVRVPRELFDRHWLLLLDHFTGATQRRFGIRGPALPPQCARQAELRGQMARIRAKDGAEQRFGHRKVSATQIIVLEEIDPKVGTESKPL